MKKRLAVLGAVAALAAACDPPLDVAPGVQMQDLQGTWYEIAHLPRPTQQGCSNTTATYTPIDKSTMGVSHVCLLPTGDHLTSTASLYATDPSAQARMKIDLGGFFGDYDVITMAADKSWFVVGHPSRQYLWVLSRDKHMAQADLDSALTYAKQDGFDTTKVEYTSQDGTGSIQPSAGGCDASGAPARGATGLGVLVAGALALAARRRKG